MSDAPKTAQYPKISHVSLGASTDYWQTLNHPEAVHGVVIPDTSFQQSATQVNALRGSVTTSSNGLGGLWLGSSDSDFAASFIPSQAACGFTKSTSTGTTFVIGATTGPAATAAAPFAQANTTAGVDAIQFTPGPSTAQVASQWRLVSAVVHLFPTGPALSTKGTFYVGALPGNAHTDSNSWDGETSTTLKNQYISQEYEITNGHMVRIVYTPTDSHAFNYVSLDSIPSDPNYDWQSHDPMECYIYWEGANNGDIFNYEITYNWELIPRAATNQLSCRPSLVDYAAMEYALNHLASLVQISMVPMSSNMSTSNALSRMITRSTPFQPVINMLPNGGVTAIFPSVSSRLRSNLSADNEIYDANYRSRVAGKSLLERLGDGLLTLAEHVAPNLLRKIGIL